MATRAANKLLVIGWDAADWILIDALFAQGKMPNLRRLVDAGVRSDLSTQDPKLSPILWTSIATGKTADKHGILNFVEPSPNGEGLRVSASTSRKTKALWNIATQSALKVNVVSWYASHPAEPISGCCVTNLFQDGEPAKSGAAWSLQPGAIHPEGMGDSLAGCRVAGSDISRELLTSMIPRLAEVKAGDDHPRTLAKQLARMATVHQATLKILRSTDWDCTMAFFETVDTIGHHFMEFHPPRMNHVSKEHARLYGDVMLKTYEHHDKCLGELLDAAPSGTTVILLSDHGFHSGDRRPVITQTDPQDRAAVEASWHRPLGVLVMSGPGIRKGATPTSPNILDVTPTALALLGLATGKDMDGRVLAESFDQPYSPVGCESWDAVPGDAGLHPEDMRSDPFESADALNQLIDLGYMPPIGESMRASIDLAARETKFNLGVVYMSTGRHAQAEPIFAQLHEQFPDQVRFSNNLANCQFNSRAYDRCELTVRKLLSGSNGTPELRLLQAGSLAHLGRTADAIAVARKIEGEITKRPDLAQPLADLWSLLGESASAARLYKVAMAHDPTDHRPHVGLARAALARGDWEAAIDPCLDASEKSQLVYEAHDYLGVALAWLGDTPHAIQSFQNAVRLKPGLINCHRFLALLHTSAGDAKLAQQHLDTVQRLREAMPESPLEVVDSWGPAAWAKSKGLHETA